MTTNSRKATTAEPAARCEKPRCEKVRGIGTFEGDRFTFKPEKKGEAVQKNIVQHGKSKIYETSGTKQRSMVAHLVVDGDTTDPAYAMSEALRELCGKSGYSAPTFAPGCVKLADEDSLTICIEREKQEVHCHFTLPLANYGKLQKDLFAMVSKVINTFGQNEWNIKNIYNQSNPKENNKKEE